MPYVHDVLDELHLRHPELTVEVRSLGFAEQFAELADGGVQAAFLRPPLPPDLDSVTLTAEPRVVCLAEDDPLAAADRLDLTDLGDRPVVDVPPEVPRFWWDFWAANPRPDGRPARFGPVVSGVEGLLLAVARGQAVAFLPAAARTLFPRPGVRYVDVPGLPPTRAALAWHRAHASHPSTSAAAEAARRVRANHRTARGGNPPRRCARNAPSSCAR